MNAVTSLLDFILNLLRDPQDQAQFRANPERMLAEHGLTGVGPGDIHEALPLVTDHRAVQLNSSGNSAPSVTTPPPVQPAAGESETHAAIRYLNYITNTYTYADSHNTIIDDSVHQNIWASGDVTQTFGDSNVVASGHGAVAAGGSIDGTVTTGNGDAVGTGAAAGSGNVTGSGNALGAGSVVGNDNAVANGAGNTIGNENTVANGTGSVAGTGDTVANGTHDVQGDGNVQGQVSGSQVATTGGSASSNWSNHWVNDNGNTDLHSYGSGDTNTIGNENTNFTATDSGNTSDSQNVSNVGNTSHSYNWPESYTVTDSYGDNGTHIDHSGLGNSYTQDSVHDAYDAHDAAMELHLH
jgi:hypothetical protein